jgi:predicted MPP superfamily phosphohydrolase
MRILLTADLHYNHARSRPLADDLIDQMNRAGGDVLVVIGDTATHEGDALEQCLSRFRFPGPKLIVAGNHELWTLGADSYAIFTDELPRRMRALGWQWLETDPFISPGADLAIIGTVGWYDYSFAQANLEIPHRFYEHKVSPGAAAYLGGSYAPLIDEADDLSPRALKIVARWNDGRYVKLHRSDQDFLAELTQRFDRQLAAAAHVKTVVAVTHHLPFAELLPPPRTAQWDFAKAYLGAAALGRTLLRHTNVRHAYCGHSHFPAAAQIQHIAAVNIGSGYRAKAFKTLEF